MKMLCYLNPNLFITLEYEQFVLWNYMTHEEHLLSIQTLSRLQTILKSGMNPKNRIDQQLLNLNIISTSPPKTTEWAYGLIAKIFHYGSKDTFNLKNVPEDQNKALQDFFETVKNLAKVRFPKATPEKLSQYPIIKLPPAQRSFKNQSFISVLIHRKTSRAFIDKKISLRQLSNILYYTFSFKAPIEPHFSEFKKIGIEPAFSRRTSPSGGSLQPVMPYIMILRVKGIQPGLYFYDSEKHHLRLINPVDLTHKLGLLLAGQYFAENLAFGVFFAAKFSRQWAKYKFPRAYRVLLLDVGHLSQTLQLCATASGLNTWLSGAFYDTGIEKLLKIKSPTEQLLFFAGVGSSLKAAAFDSETQRYFLEKIKSSKKTKYG